MPVVVVVEGELGVVHRYIRKGGRCPYNDFMKKCQPRMTKRFKGSFQALVGMGAEYENGQRFCPLKVPGKPLWEFKEFDHRLYCFREVQGNKVRVVLLSGWIKDKDQGKEEKRMIQKALNLLEELRAGGGC